MGYGKIIAFEFARQHYHGSEKILKELTPLYPIYTLQPNESNFLNNMHEDYCLSSGGTILREEDNKKVQLHSERPTDIIFDPSGLPVDESILEFGSLSSFLETDTVCYDSMVFFTSVDNPVNSLTTNQIQGIYSGKITNWKELGGDDIKIDVYHRGESTMNRDYMENIVMNGSKIKETNYVRLKEPISYATNTFHKYPKEYQNSPQSIGYCYKSLIDRFYGDSVKILNVNDVEPTDENIRSEKYPYAIPCLAYTRKDKTGDLGKKVIEWLKSSEGKKSMDQMGYVPVE